MKKCKNKLIGIIALSFSVMLSANLLKSEALIIEKTQKSTIKEKKSGLILHPIFYYTPETKTAFGAGGMYFFQTSKNKSRIRHSYILLGFEYTLMNQFKFGLEPDIYLKNEKYHLTGGISFRKFPSKFYGIGNNTAVDMEESYTPNTIDLRMVFQRKVRPELFLGLEYVFTQDSINEVEEDGLLAGGKIPGSTGAKASGIGILSTLDSRNNSFYPSSGNYFQLSTTIFNRFLGSDYNFNRIKLDFRNYFTLFSSHVLALQSFFCFQAGNIPFQKMSLLGGEEIMRGYYRGRYRDKNMIAFQMEYRIAPAWWRLGLVGFVGVADVASRLDRFDLGNFKYSYGFGIRYLFRRKEKINIRLDFAYGNGSSGFYIVLREAF
jgi:outer membrane protein assembly factor BamA